MRKRRMLASVITCMGAVIGAGFASGQEVLQFFSRYGALSWVGILLSCGAMTVFSCILMNRANTFQAKSLAQLCGHSLGKGGWIGTWAFLLLYSVTGGTMLAAAGEIFSLIWPWQYGYWVGVLCTLALALYCVGGSIRPMEAVSAVMLPFFIVVLLMMLALPHGHEPILWEVGRWPNAFSQAISYGALNITLAAAVLLETGRELNGRCRCRTALWLGICLAVVLGLGNGVLLRHPEVFDRALPFVHLLQSFGKTGYYLGAGVLYLAVLTTLLAVARGLHGLVGESWPKAPALAVTGTSMLVLSLSGFSGLVGKAYPILGYICLGILLWIAGTKVKHINRGA